MGQGGRGSAWRGRVLPGPRLAGAGGSGGGGWGWGLQGLGRAAGEGRGERPCGWDGKEAKFPKPL